MYLASWQLWTVGIAFVTLLWQVRRTRRQVRCLRFCYLEISDWTADTLSAIFAQASDEGIADRLSSSDWRAVWGRHLDDHAGMWRRVGLRPARNGDRTYLLADLDAAPRRRELL